MRQIAHAGVGLEEALAGIGLDFARRNAQQSRFARAVAPDQRHALAKTDGKVRIRNQRFAAKGEGDVLKQEKRGSSHRRYVGYCAAQRKGRVGGY